MNFFVEIKFLLIGILFEICFGYQNVIIQIVNDVISNEHGPTNLIIFCSCWNFDLVKKLSRIVTVPIQQYSPSKPYESHLDKPNLMLFLHDQNCEDDDISQINAKLFSHPYRWIIIEKIASKNNLNNRNLIDNIEAYPDSNIILVRENIKVKGNFTLEQFYRIEKNSPIIIEKFGTWNAKNGLTDDRTTRILSRRRKDLAGKILTASVVITSNNTHNHLNDYKEKHIDSISKVNYAIVNRLMDTLNATKKFTYVPSWGYYDATTARWSGMIGDLDRKIADIGGTALFVTDDRVSVIEYLSMTTPTRTRFVFRAPPLSYMVNIYSLPFVDSVWLCSGIFIILCVIGIFSISRLENFYDRKGDKWDLTRLSDIILLAVGAICQMGSNFEPRLYSARILTIFLFIILLFLYTSYTANIVSLLQSSTKSITTLESLLNSQLEFGAEDTVYNRYYFETAKEPTRKAIYEQKIAPPKKPSKFMNISYGISRLREGLFAFHMELGPGYKLVEETFFEHEKCGLMEIQYIQVSDPWLAIQKYSPYKEMIKVNIFKIREHGIQLREYAKIYTKKPICDSHGQNFGSVRLTDCLVAVIILGYGYLLAIVFFIIEKILFIRKPRILLNL